MEQENKKKVEEQPIVEEKKETSFAKKVGKWFGIAIAGAGLVGAGFYFGRKSGATSTTTTTTVDETETI